MPVKTKIAWAFAFSLVGAATGYFLWKIYNCGYSSFCYFLFSKVGMPLFYAMGALAIVFSILFLVPKAVSAWWKFAIWYVPIGAYVMVTSGPGEGGWMNVQLGPSIEQYAEWISAIYVIASLIIIGWKYISPEEKSGIIGI